MILQKKRKMIADYLGVILILFAIYRSLPFAQIVPTLIARQFSFLLILGMVYLTTEPWKNSGKAGLFYNIVFFLAGAISIIYLISIWAELPYRMMNPITKDIIFGTLLIITTLDMLRRKTGWPLVIISVIFISYMLFGTQVPIKILKHAPYSWSDTVFALTTGPKGIWGAPLGTIIDFVVIFIAFGSILLYTGVINYFLRLACFLTRRLKSGPALVAVISSGMFGMISGSAAGNVSTTGNFTIPLMKSVGYSGETAGGIEVAASIGGQWMPPVMGAAAFIMASLLGIPYLTVMQNAFIPAVLYFITVAAMVIAITGRKNISPMPQEEIDKLLSTTTKEWILSSIHVGIPVLVLMYFLIIGFSPGVAASYSVIILLVLSVIIRGEKETLKERLSKIWEGLIKAGYAVLPVALATAAAGIIIGSIVTTGAAVKFTALIVNFSGGNLLISILLIILASLFLGMGSPVTAAYLIVAIVSAGALVELGLPPIVAHLICFWYAIDSEVTPPVCISSYAAAGIANSDPFKTAIQGWKAAKGLYLIPILVAISPIVPATWGTGVSYLDIFLAIITAMLGLISLSFVLERYFLRKLNIIEVLGIGINTIILMLPYRLADIIGIGIFVAFTIFLKRTSFKKVIKSQQVA